MLVRDLVLLFCIGKAERLKFADSLIKVSYHLAKPIPQSGVLVYEDFLGLIFEEVFDTRNVNFFAVSILILNLSHVKCETLESTCVDFLIKGNLIQS